MTQTDNTAIRGAFFGLLILFGIFILAAWSFDYLTGRGLSSQPPVLSLSVYAPAVSEPQWGKTSHGLRCKLSFSRPDPSQFSDISVNVQFENITNDTLAFLFDPNEILKAVSAVNSDKWKLKLSPIPREFIESSDKYISMYESSVQTIKPKEIFDGKIECQIDNVVKDTGFIDGYFDFVCKLDIDKSKISQIQSASDLPVWTGKIKSGTCEVYLTMPHDGGCNDCHGDADYHHGVLQDCRFCHAESTNILHETCIRCHKRDDQKIYGRRRVLGPEGDFDNISKHISGIIEDSDCLVCHDMTRHGYGTVFLADPNSTGKRTFTNEYTEFCLSCHNSNPPEGVTFPEKSANAKPEDYSYLLENYGNSEDKSDDSDNNPFAGLSSFSGFNSLSENDSGSEEDNGYPEATLTPQESSGYQGVESMMTEPTTDSEEQFHSDSEVSIYDKSDFINSELYKKGVECTDCHRSHGSNRPSLLKNVHGPDDKVRI